MATYPSIGNVARLSATFTDSSGTLTDPTTTTVEIQPPGGVAKTTATPTHDGTGLFHYDLTLDTAGFWYYRFIGTGAVVARTGDQSIHVLDAQFS